MSLIKSLHPQCPNALDLAHYMPWFHNGQDGHPDQGYDTSDPATALDFAQVWQSLGGDGFIPDWYGPNRYENDGTLAIFTACQQLKMKFMLCLDQGIPGGQSGMDSALLYAKTTYFGSPQYIKDEFNRNIVLQFDANSLDWATLAAKYNLRVVFRGTGTGDRFTWWHESPNDATLVLQEQAVMFPSAYPGTNDTSSWGGGRKVDYQNGQTLLNTLHAIPLTTKYIQWVTWNDAEEGTGMLGNMLDAVSNTKYPKVARLPLGNVLTPPVDPLAALTARVTELERWRKS